MPVMVVGQSLMNKIYTLRSKYHHSCSRQTPPHIEKRNNREEKKITLLRENRSTEIFLKKKTDLRFSVAGLTSVIESSPELNMF